MLAKEQAYDVLLIDPPWPKKKGGVRRVRALQGRELDYPTLSLQEIKNILDGEILPLASDRHVIFLWSIDSFLTAGEQMFLDRGYRLHARLVWNKLNGVAPAFTIRYAHEYLLWFYRTPMLPIDQQARGIFTSVFSERARQHSRKPDIAYSMIERLYPLAKRLDVFARGRRAGWDSWGDQVDYEWSA